MNENLINALSQNGSPMAAAVMKAFAQGFDIESIPGIKELKCVKEFYTLPAGDPKEAELKKAISTAVIIAKDKGIPVPGLDGKNPTEIASIVDAALTYSKALYLVGEGKLDSYELVSHLVDKAAPRVVAVLDSLIDRYTEPALEAIARAVACVCPPAIEMLPIVKAAAPYIAEQVKHTIHQALPKAIKVTKEVLSTAVNKATRVFVQTTKKVIAKLLS